MKEPLLAINGLVVEFDTDAGQVRAVDDVSIDVQRGETLGLVGESGCGKSVTALSIMRLLPQPTGQIAGGEIRFAGQDLTQLPLDAMRRVRGARIGMIFQEPMTALNPVHTIGRQLAEALLLHEDLRPPEALQRSLAMLDRVGIPAPDVRMGEYPHQLSGGMRQRVVIAMALACKPDLLIADEPTTALDVTVQAQILDLIEELQRDLGMAVILITHDLGVIAETSDQAAVMYAGRIAEKGAVHDIFDHPSHPYTQGLLASIPTLATTPKATLPVIDGMVPGLADLPPGCRFQNRCEHRRPACGERAPSEEQVAGEHRVSCLRWREIAGAAVPINLPSADSSGGGRLADSHRTKSEAPLLEVTDLAMHFPVRAGVLRRAKRYNRAVDGVSLTIGAGETLGLVGESGCGKSTLGRCIVRLYDATAGRIAFQGQETTHLRARRLKPIRRSIQMVFQDPMESLNARHTVGEIIAEPLLVQRVGDRASRQRRVRELLDTVGLPAASARRYPFEFSGGQRQRIGIARAIALNPRLVICDEPVSALDVSIQSQILNLLNRLQRELGLSYLFIAHDLAVVKHISDRIAIMYLGKIVEMGGGEDVYRKPRHPYTQSLIGAIPIPDPHRRAKRIVLAGDVPSPIDPPSGCAFHPRCPLASERCRVESPVLRDIGATGRRVACHMVA